MDSQGKEVIATDLKMPTSPKQLSDDKLLADLLDKVKSGNIMLPPDFVASPLDSKRS